MKINKLDYIIGGLILISIVLVSWIAIMLLKPKPITFPTADGRNLTEDQFKSFTGNLLINNYIGYYAICIEKVGELESDILANEDTWSKEVLRRERKRLKLTKEVCDEFKIIYKANLVKELSK